MDKSGGRRHVHEAMKALPSASAQTPNRCGCRSNRERRHGHERDQANREKRSLHNVAARGGGQITDGDP